MVGGDLPFLKADIADLSVRLLPLLGQKIEMSAITMHRPKVEIVKNMNGVWNFSSLLDQTSSSSQTGVVLKGNLIVHDGQVVVTNLQRTKNRKVYWFTFEKVP
jgi:uncharacterized protein involved in outer membrane biogenesis